jgi:hypothetical protein
MADEKKENTGQAGSKPDSEVKSDFAMPEINFSTFVMSLNASTLVHLGLTPDPLTGERATNLPLAKQTIDILAMLEEKTRGNLTDDEGRLLTHVLYELRVMYVKKK